MLARIRVTIGDGIVKVGDGDGWVQRRLLIIRFPPSPAFAIVPFFCLRSLLSIVAAIVESTSRAWVSLSLSLCTLLLVSSVNFITSSLHSTRLPYFARRVYDFNCWTDQSTSIASNRFCSEETQLVSTMALLSAEHLAGPGYIILNTMRGLNIIALASVVASSIVMLVKTFIISKVLSSKYITPSPKLITSSSSSLMPPVTSSPPLLASFSSSRSVRCSATSLPATGHFSAQLMDSLLWAVP